MRILLLSDIHANLEALTACLDAAPAHDRVINLGDIVGYGASPNEVAERTRELGTLIVRGNHDKAVTGLTDLKDFNPIAGLAALWTRDQLTRQNFDWLHGLGQGPLKVDDIPDAQFVHGSMLGEDEYVINPDEAAAPLQQSPVAATFFGHTHLQGGFLGDGTAAAPFYARYQTIGKIETWDFELKPGFRYLINPGSVGQPRDGDWRAAFATFNTETRVVSFHRVPYDLKSAQERILAANLPPRLAMRLAAGR